jgi:hypothetical protein
MIKREKTDVTYKKSKIQTATTGTALDYHQYRLTNSVLVCKRGIVWRNASSTMLKSKLLNIIPESDIGRCHFAN